MTSAYREGDVYDYTRRKPAAAAWFRPAAWRRQQYCFLAVFVFGCSRCVWWSAWVFLFRWRWCLEFYRRIVPWSNSTISCRTTGRTMWHNVTFRMGHPGPHVSLWWIAGDWQSCSSHSATSQHWHKPIIPSRSLPQPSFPFSEAMIKHFQKIQQE